jgi:hypothetical protein
MPRHIEYFVIGTTLPLVPFGIHGYEAVVTLAMAGGDYFAVRIIRIGIFIKRVLRADRLAASCAFHAVSPYLSL